MKKSIKCTLCGKTYNLKEFYNKFEKAVCFTCRLKFKSIIELMKSEKFISKKEAEIINMRFGFNKDYIIYTLNDIGKIYGVTRERIRQIEARSLYKIYLHTKDIKDEFNMEPLIKYKSKRIVYER